VPPAPSPLEAFRALLRVQLGEIRRHEPGTRIGEDPESLHKMRVAVRRSLALLRAGRNLAAGDATELADGLRRLGGELGAVRDLDVLLERLRGEAAELGDPDAGAAARLLEGLEREREAARASLLAALDNDGYRALLDRFEAHVDGLEPAEGGASLGDLVRRQAAKLRRAVRALPADPPDDELHAVRKLGKRTRYAAELAGKKRVVRHAKRLQDVLGSHQDAVVAEERLRSLAAAAPPDEAIVAGRLAERERARRAEARRRWSKVWRRLDRALR